LLSQLESRTTVSLKVGSYEFDHFDSIAICYFHALATNPLAIRERLTSDVALRVIAK